MRQAASIDESINESGFHQVLFTDQVVAARQFAATLSNLMVDVREIESYGWPEATLKRYEIISNARSVWGSDDILVYLDADMQVVAPLVTEDFVSTARETPCLVLHPGYYRPRSWALFRLYLKSPAILIRDLAMTAKIGALGAWEKRPTSQAFVRRRNRQGYYYGGVWWGRASDIICLCKVLAKQVALDSANGVMAIWHDESHLNHWAANNAHASVSPIFCSVESWPWLKGLQAKIIAVNKPDVCNLR